jgi:Spermine/spermidine synthase domain
MRSPKTNYYAGIFLISLATLLLELSLTRVMSVSLWYHFGFLVISTALMGFGTAGVVLASWKKLREEYDLNKTLAVLSLLFGFATVLSFWLLQKIPFNPFSLATDKRQWYVMPLYYITIAAPFFISGLILSLLFTRMAQRMSRLYAWDLLGAAAGCVLIIWVMPAFGGSGSMVIAAALGVLATLAFSTKIVFHIATIIIFSALCILAFLANDWLPIKITENKRQVSIKRVPIYTKWNTFSYIEVFERKPDKATGYKGSRVFAIDAGTASTGIDDNLSGGVNDYLQTHTADSIYKTVGAFFHLPSPSVLIIGSGGGTEVLDALHKNARRIVCVEINPIINKAVKGWMNNYLGGLFHQPTVELVTEEGRSYINRSKEKFDVIISSHTISNAAVASGSLSLSENYVLTKEALAAYYDHLTENGVLFFTRPESQLPRLFTTSREVLAEHGITGFNTHFYAYRRPPSKAEGAKSFIGNFIMKKSAFTPDEIERIDSFVLTKHQLTDSVWKLQEKLYDPYHDGLQNIYDTIVSIPDIKAFYREYPAQVEPATDDKPFFNQHVRWSHIGWHSFRDVFSQNTPVAARMALENKPIAEVTLIIILLQSILLSALLILIPLLRYSRNGLRFNGKWRYLGYFAMLGLGFIMIEISFIQRFTLYLGQPVYTLAVIIAGLLLFTGAGSYLTGKWDIQSVSLKRKYLPLLLLVLLLTSYLTPPLFHATLHWALHWRIVLTLILLAPLGILLGMPFPTGIQSVSRQSAAFIPWAWGVNGFFTVIGSVGALILGMMLGFRIVIGLAAVCYLLAMIALPRK